MTYTPAQAKEARAAAQRRYAQSEKGIAGRKRRSATPEFKARAKAFDQARANTPRRLATQANAYAKYDASTKGIVRRCRADVARYRREALALQD